MERFGRASVFDDGQERVFRNATIILMSAVGRSKVSIANDLGCSPATVDNIRKGHRQRGLDRLKPGKPSRRQSRATPEYRQTLRATVQTPPQTLGLGELVTAFHKGARRLTGKRENECMVALKSSTAVHPAILDLNPPTLTAWLGERGYPAHHARQIRRWILEKRAESFESITELSKELRALLGGEFVIFGTQVAAHQAARDGTHKLLLRLQDGQTIECVLLQEDDRRTACISTQVGCGMACVFCASGLGGLLRNLTVGEILEQLVRLRNLLPAQERLSHIVVMGMGEPLANLDSLIEALDAAGDKNGLGIGARHITISTVGLPAKIRRLADLGKQYHLAVSLHAPNDRLRTQIVPTNEKTGLAEILAAADYFFEKTGRQVTFEYVLLGGINDSLTQAKELVRLLRGRHAHVNLIPFNDVEGLPYRRPSDEALTEFVDSLHEGGLSVKVRKRKGSEIDAACGQLRRKVEESSDLFTMAEL